MFGLFWQTWQSIRLTTWTTDQSPRLMATFSMKTKKHPFHLYFESGLEIMLCDISLKTEHLLTMCLKADFHWFVCAVSLLRWQNKMERSLINQDVHVVFVRSAFHVRLSAPQRNATQAFAGIVFPVFPSVKFSSKSRGTRKWSRFRTKRFRCTFKIKRYFIFKVTCPWENAR